MGLIVYIIKMILSPIIHKNSIFIFFNMIKIRRKKKKKVANSLVKDWVLYLECPDFNLARDRWVRQIKKRE